MVSVTPVYAGLLAVFLMILSVSVGAARGKTGIVLGHGEHTGLHLAIRRFGNQAEYVPLALVVLLMMELRGMPEVWLHAFGAALIGLRLLHPLVLFDRPDAPLWQKVGRGVSAAGTALLIAAGGVALLV